MLSSNNPSLLNMTWPLTKEQQLLVNVLLRFWVVAVEQELCLQFESSLALGCLILFLSAKYIVSL